MTHVKNSLLTLHRHQSCVPTKRGIKMLEISVWLYPRLSNFQPECSIAVIEEHTECECGCSVQEEDCIAGFQKFNKDRCECTCLDREAQDACFREGIFFIVFSNPLCFHEFFLPKFFAIFLVKSKLLTAKYCKSVVISRIFSTKFFRNFSR